MTVQLERAGRMLLRESESAETQIESASELAKKRLEETQWAVWKLHPDRREFASLSEAKQAKIGTRGPDGIQIAL